MNHASSPTRSSKNVVKSQHEVLKIETKTYLNLTFNHYQL